LAPFTVIAASLRSQALWAWTRMLSKDWPPTSSARLCLAWSTLISDVATRMVTVRSAPGMNFA
jgi:hypothetical protein